MAWRRIFIGLGTDGGDEQYGMTDDTQVTREDSMVMLTATLGDDELEIMIKPSLYPAMMNIMKEWIEEPDGAQG